MARDPFSEKDIIKDVREMMLQVPMLSKMLMGLLSVLVGIFIGHWLSIGRDKRVEFNKASEPIFEAPEHQLLLSKKNRYPNQGDIPTDYGLIKFK
jgi:hypothetical protein